MSRTFEADDLVLSLADMRVAADGADLLARFAVVLRRWLKDGRRDCFIEGETDKERAKRYGSDLYDATVSVEMILDVALHLSAHLDDCVHLGQERAQKAMMQLGSYKAS